MAGFRDHLAWMLPAGAVAAALAAAATEAFKVRRLRRALVAARLEIQGHRGYGDHEPHNTLRAMRAAAADPAVRSVEFDVRRTKDGEIVVTHGPEAGARHGGPDLSQVEQLTLHEAQELDLGFGERLPRLADLVKVCAEAGVLMNVELKDDDPQCVDGTLSILREKKVLQLCRISSFKRSALEQVRSKAPGVPIGALYHAGYKTGTGSLAREPAPQDFASWWPAGSSAEDSVNLCAECITEALVAEARRHGKKVMVWFPCVPITPGWQEGPAIFERLIDLGVDVVCCNRMEVLAKVKQQASAF